MKTRSVIKKGGEWARTYANGSSNSKPPQNKGNSYNNLGNQIYDGAASFGRFMSIVSLVIGSIIAIVLLVIGFYLLFTKTKYTGETDGKVTSVNCSTQAGKGSSCSAVVEYTVKNITYKTTLNTSGSLYEGQIFKMVYIPEEPAKAQVKGISRKVIGGILIGVAVFVFGLAFLHYYIVNRFKFAAAASGVGTGVEMIT